MEACSNNSMAYRLLKNIDSRTAKNIVKQRAVVIYIEFKHNKQ